MAALRPTAIAAFAACMLAPVLAQQPPAAPSALAAPGSGAEPEAVWPKPDLFWYRRTVPGGNLWLKVDAEHGVREPLFDHQRLAIELSLRTGREFTPLTLPLADPAAGFVVKFDGSNAYIQEGAMAIEFVLDGAFWRCDLQIKWDWNRVPPTDYECLSRRSATEADAALRRTATSRTSPDGRWEAAVEGHNVFVRPRNDLGSAVALSTDGSAADGYHPGSLHWSADSSALSAYRVQDQVLASAAATGSVKAQVLKRTWRQPFRAVHWSGTVTR
jgi:hypothetical protein